MKIAINGASDDLVELAVNGVPTEEFDAVKGSYEFLLRAPDGDQVRVVAVYSRGGTWLVGAGPSEDDHNPMPDWGIRVVGCPDTKYSGMLVLDVPDGTEWFDIG